MTSSSARLIPVIVLLLAAPAMTQQFAFAPERLFVMGDTDLDGRLALDEYWDFMRNAPRMAVIPTPFVTQRPSSRPRHRRRSTDDRGLGGGR